MTKSTDREPAPAEQGASEHDDVVAALTRRTVLAGAAAATAAATIGVDAPALAQPPAPPSDFDVFLTLSAALTGIARAKLAPNVDPLDVKTQYFNRASGKKDDQQKIEQDDRRAAFFAALVKIARDANLQVPPTPATDGIIKQEDVARLVTQIEQGGDDVKYLARSIVLMWYLGSWYEPVELKRLATPTNSIPFIGHEVVSPAAYTTGWVWRIAQAHPMGYSDMQFGYWTHPPQPIADFIAVRNPKGGN